MVDNVGTPVVRIRTRLTTIRVGVGRPDNPYLKMESSSIDSNVETVLNHGHVDVNLVGDTLYKMGTYVIVHDRRASPSNSDRCA